MPLRTSPARLVACLVPPGNIARELSLFRRRLFSGLGEALALSLPDLVFLAMWQGPDPRDGRRAKAEARLALAKAWEGLTGAFALAAAAKSGGWLHLPVSGPLGLLRERLGDAGKEALGLPFPLAEGFLLMPLAGEGSASGEAAGLIATAPAASFHSASLALYRFDVQESGLRALRWSEVLAVQRPRAATPA
jgi:hypothetical protein